MKYRGVYWAVFAPMIRGSFFTPPFETPESLRERLKGAYSRAKVGNVRSIAYFQCVK